MTKEDIINYLDPDMFKCLISHEWININNEYNCEHQWRKSKSPFKTNFSVRNCIKHCPKFLHHRNNILNKTGNLL